MGIKSLGDLNGKAVLEAGCGHGAILKELAVAFETARLTGIDFSPEQVRLAQKHTKDLSNVVILLKDVRLIDPKEHDAFDEIISIFGAFDFVSDPSELVDILSSCLKIGGKLSILTSKSSVYESLSTHRGIQLYDQNFVGQCIFIKATKQ